jgi:hypothetical protein
MFTLAPDIYPSWIPVPGFNNSNKREGNKLVVLLFCGHKYLKIVKYFIFELVKKKFIASSLRIIVLFTQKLSLISQKYGVGIRDQGFGINLFRTPDPVVINAPDPQHW